MMITWLWTILAENLWSLLVTTVLASGFYWFGVRNHRYWASRGVKGPRSVPFLGNMQSLTVPIPTLYREYHRKFGNVFGCFQGQSPHLFVCDSKIIQRILVKDFHNFRNRPTNGTRHRILSLNLISARGESWKRIRSILSPTFTGSKLKKMEPLISECHNSLRKTLDNVAVGPGSFVAHDLMGQYTMDVIAKCAFATDINRTKTTTGNGNYENQFVTNAKAGLDFSIVKTLLVFAVPPIVQRLLSVMRIHILKTSGLAFFLELGRHLLAERRQSRRLTTPREKPDDMLQLMLNAEYQQEVSIEMEDQFDAHHVNQGKEELEQEKKLLQNISGDKYLSEDEILAQLLLFFLAGYETTASTLSYCLYSLATVPEVQEKLYREVAEAKLQDPLLGYQTVTKLPYLDAVLAETLRKYSPAMAIHRDSSNDYYIPEYNLTVEKGVAIMIPISAIHMSEQYFPDPERFDPERFMPENAEKLVPYSYLPFGGGPRNCIGMRFAMAEAKLALAQLVDRYQFHPVDKTPKRLDPLLALIIFRTYPIHLGIKLR